MRPRAGRARDRRHVRTHQTSRTAPARTVRATPTKEMAVECTVSTVWARTSWPSGVCRVTSMGSRSPEVRAWAVTRTEVVGRSSSSWRVLPLGKVNLSLARVTTTRHRVGGGREHGDGDGGPLRR